jgi:uncharacterized protein YkwD
MRVSTSVELKRAAILVISVLVASLAALSASVADPELAQAAGGGHVKKCGGGEIFLNEEEKETFALHNKIRRERDLPAFCVHLKLQKAARAHSEDMIRRDYFSHDTKGKSETFDERVKRYGYIPRGYSFYLIGENIAYGSGTSAEPGSIMRAWMSSEGHRHNILNGKFKEIGIGTYSGTWQGYDGVRMYTADFGIRRG